MPTAAIQDGRPAADCPPAPVRVTKSLLGYGVIAGPFYVAASLGEALTRPGFSLAHDDWSLLANGGLGFLGLITACLVLACQFRGLCQVSWAIFSLVTGVLFFAAFAGIAVGGATSSAGVLAFTGAVILAWTWLALVSAHLYRRAAAAAA